jgi:hypothetical protein
MRGPYYRACRRHKEALEDRTPGFRGHEILWCNVGKHRCRSWLVMDGDGETLAIGFMNEAPQITSLDLMGASFDVAPLPERFCHRGHFEWVLENDNKYRCRICRRDRSLRLNQQRAGEAKGHASGEKSLQNWLDANERRQLNKKIRKEQRCRILPTK